jgi:hypothetical protein
MLTSLCFDLDVSLNAMDVFQTPCSLDGYHILEQEKGSERDP